jgi:hypothetical protein
VQHRCKSIVIATHINDQDHGAVEVLDAVNLLQALNFCKHVERLKIIFNWYDLQWRGYLGPTNAELFDHMIDVFRLVKCDGKIELQLQEQGNGSGMALRDLPYPRQSFAKLLEELNA